MRLVQRCSSAKALSPSERQRACPQWMSALLYPNDIYVWAVLLRIAHTGIDVAGDVCCLEHGLTQGWLPWHTSAQVWRACIVTHRHAFVMRSVTHARTWLSSSPTAL